MRSELGAAIANAALLLAAAPGLAQTGYSGAPFRDQPADLARAAALERVAVAALALAAQPAGAAAVEDAAGGDQDTGAEEEERGALADAALFRASLAAAAPDLAERLDAATEAMVEAAETGTPATGPAADVIGLAAEARDRLLPPEDSPGFRAALMAGLLLDEGGVAEGYEEAVAGDAAAYAKGYFALQRVEELWQGLAARATPEQAAEVEATLAILDGLFPAPALPAALSPDPEQAEAPAQQLVGLLETVADAELYPGRDLAGATALVRDLAARGCDTLGSGDAAIGREELAIAAAFYVQTLADTLGVLAPEAGEAIWSNLEAAGAGAAAEKVCRPLLAALATASEALTQ